jgi:hypothetical protein
MTGLSGLTAMHHKELLLAMARMGVDMESAGRGSSWRLNSFERRVSKICQDVTLIFRIQLLSISFIVQLLQLLGLHHQVANPPLLV